MEGEGKGVREQRETGRTAQSMLIKSVEDRHQAWHTPCALESDGLLGVGLI